MSSITRAPNPAPHGISQDDWDDVDSPEMTDAELADLRPASEMPEEVYALLPKRGRGRPKSENPKVNVTIRMDREVLDAFKATGKGWQTKMNDTLKRSAVTGRFLKGDKASTSKEVRSLAASVLTQGDYKASAGTRVARASDSGRLLTSKGEKKGGKKDTA